MSTEKYSISDVKKMYPFNDISDAFYEKVIEILNEYDLSLEKKDVYILQNEETKKVFIHLSLGCVRKILDKNNVEYIRTFIVNTGDSVLYKNGELSIKRVNTGKIYSCIGELKLKDSSLVHFTEVFFNDYYKPTTAWGNMPYTLMQKICEASLARKVFPLIFSDLYVEEEPSEDVKQKKEDQLAFLKKNRDASLEIMKKHQINSTLKNLTKEQIDLIYDELIEKGAM